jgi:hypothetical protein
MQFATQELMHPDAANIPAESPMAGKF